jgi:hypothetical protein
MPNLDHEAKPQGRVTHLNWFIGWLAVTAMQLGAVAIVGSINMPLPRNCNCEKLPTVRLACSMQFLTPEGFQTVAEVCNS